MTTEEWNRNVEQDADGYETLAAGADERANETRDAKDKSRSARWRDAARYYRQVAAKIRELVVVDLVEVEPVCAGRR